MSCCKDMVSGDVVMKKEYDKRCDVTVKCWFCDFLFVLI